MMSWNVRADLREGFAELLAFKDTNSYFFRSLNRQENLLGGLIESIGQIPEFDAKQAHLQILTDLENITLREKWGGPAALLATEGFQTFLEIHKSDSQPISPENSFGVTERISKSGSIEMELDLKEIEFILSKLEMAKIKDVAICFLHSNVNPEHEKKVAQFLKDKGFSPHCSYEFKGSEFERGFWAAKKAYMAETLREFTTKLETLGFSRIEFLEGTPYLNSKNHEMRLLIQEDRIECAIDLDGKILRKTLKSNPLNLVQLDSMRVLHVGPKSATADPGPACFGRGLQLTILDFLALSFDFKMDIPRLKFDKVHGERHIKPLAVKMKCSPAEMVSATLNMFFEQVAMEIEEWTTSQKIKIENFHISPLGILGKVLAPEIAKDLGVSKLSIPYFSDWTVSSFGPTPSPKESKISLKGELTSNASSHLDEGRAYEI